MIQKIITYTKLEAIILSTNVPYERWMKAIRIRNKLAIHIERMYV